MGKNEQMDSVFQSYLEFLPREIVLKKYGKIGSIFNLEEDEKKVLRPIYYGEKRTEIEAIWNEKKLAIEDILADIEAFDITEHSLFHKPREGSNFHGNFGENYCRVRYDLESRNIYLFQFGIDITKRETVVFAETLLQIANKHNFILLGSDLETFDPTKQELDRHLRSTPAYKMIKLEDEFIKAVEEGKEKTDVPFLRVKR